MNDQLGQVCENFEKLGYIKGRNYIMDAFIEASKGKSAEIVEFVYSVSKMHSDTNVEIR